MERLKIRIKKIRDVELPKKIVQGDWIDLRVADTVFLAAGESKYIPLGVAMELPEGYEAVMAPRSSLFKKRGIMQANSLGIIDE